MDKSKDGSWTSAIYDFFSRDHMLVMSIGILIVGLACLFCIYCCIVKFFCVKTIDDVQDEQEEEQPEQNDDEENYRGKDSPLEPS